MGGVSGNWSLLDQSYRLTHEVGRPRGRIVGSAGELHPNLEPAAELAVFVARVVSRDRNPQCLHSPLVSSGRSRLFISSR